MDWSEVLVKWFWLGLGLGLGLYGLKWSPGKMVSVRVRLVQIEVKFYSKMVSAFRVIMRRITNWLFKNSKLALCPSIQKNRIASKTSCPLAVGETGDKRPTCQLVVGEIGDKIYASIGNNLVTKDLRNTYPLAVGKTGDKRPTCQLVEALKEK